VSGFPESSVGKSGIPETTQDSPDNRLPVNDERLERQKLARLREWQHFKESLYELQMDEAACPACRMARIIHETETNSPVCRGHA
jgi:hypothetical protein